MFILIFHSLKILNLQRLNSKYFRPILAFPARTLFLLFRDRIISSAAERITSQNAPQSQRPSF